MPSCACDEPLNEGRRVFLMRTAAAGLATAGALQAAPVWAANTEFMAEAARLAIESVEKGWGGPYHRARPKPRAPYRLPGFPRGSHRHHGRIKPAQSEGPARQRLWRWHHFGN